VAFRSIVREAFFVYVPIMMDDKDTIAIVGLGKVGTAVGFLLRSAGYRIAAIADTSPPALQKAATYTGGNLCTSAAEAASQAQCTIIATADDGIAPVCEQIVQAQAIRQGGKVIHMSGACGLDVLEPARHAGAHVASIHPIQSFADVSGAIKHIPGSTFGITADEAIREWAVHIVRDLGGTPFFVPEGDKPLYHAAACIASNYLVALIYAVEEIYLALGLDREEAIRSVWPLVKGTLSNIEAKGTLLSLTGPIARGDTGTIRKHVAVLRKKLPSLLPVYREVGLLAVRVGRANGSLSGNRAAEIQEILEEETHEHPGKDE
jgi:predicted short-subunit dehydrogenase-like oxidoreductase (DUF2520 family)